MQENVYLSTIAFMRSLLFLEASIADSYRVRITRSTEGKVYFSVFAIGSTKAAFSDNFKPDQFNSDDKRNARIGETLDKLDALHLIKPEFTEMTPEDSKANQVLDLLNQFDGDLAKKEAYVKKLESLLDDKTTPMLVACLLTASLFHTTDKN